MSERVQVIAPDGTRGSVDAADVGSLPDGARVLSKQEIAEERLQTAYDAQSTTQKVLGVAKYAGPAGALANLAAGGTALPEMEAYREGGFEGATMGLGHGVEHKIRSAVAGEEAGKAQAQRIDDLKAASPNLYGAGAMAGMATSALATGGAGAGTAVEAVGGRALGSLASKGVAGRAAAAAAKLGAQGALEGGAYAAGETAGDALLHDEAINGTKLYAAVGHGALSGALLGGGLGAVGSLGASGLAKLRATKAAGEGLPFASMAPNAPELAAGAARREVTLGAGALDAGLHEPFATESPFDFSRREVSLRGQGKIRKGAVDEPIDITKRLALDPDAGLHAPEGKTADAMFPFGEEGRTRLAGDLFKTPKGKVPSTSRPIRERFDLGIDPDAGIAARDSRGAFQGKFATEDPFYTSTAKDARRRVGLRDDVGATSAEYADAPFRIPTPDGEVALPWRAAEAAADGVPGADRVAKGLAADQAWKAVGAGFGLQTTRYAKEAAKHFPGGTRDLGAMAIRHGLIDMGEGGASPWSAAVAAGKSGTPDAIAARAATALDEVGAKIGAITEASGARIPLPQAMSAVDDVVRAYRREAGRGPLAAAAESYGAELRGVLRPGADGAVPIQDLLVQRKILDDIVYEEAKTLDPRGRVKALREVRSKLEGLITNALDEASGKVEGAQAAEYRALKRDYHGLSILHEAAQDSAARASKGATLGLGEKFAVGSALATGHITAAPVLGVGLKVLRERGNAAAAAFLHRAAEKGMISRAVAAVDAKVGGAVGGVLREVDSRAPTSAARGRGGRPLRSVAEGRAENAARVRQAEAIVQWTGQARANPDQLARLVQEAAAKVGRDAGPRTAEAYSAAAMKAIAFIAGHIPAKERRDPLDPRSTPPLTLDEADRLLRAARYATQPMTVWDDFERGKVTPEGIRAARTLMPEVYQDFQAKLFDHVQTHMRNGRKLSASQRLRVDKLLGFPAGPDLRPDMIASLQANLARASQPPAPAGPQGGKPVSMSSPQSGFDAVEARVSG